MSMSQLLLTKVENAFAFAQHQVRALTERDPNFYPLYTDGGRWRHQKPAWTHWCDGFLPGMMWIFHEETRDPKWLELAATYSLALEPRKDDREVHDLGFIFYHGTYKRWYDSTVRSGAPDQSLKDVVIHAGRTLALRFHERAGCLRSFHGADSNFIDIMMNVGIIAVAGLETGDQGLVDVTEQHCETTRKYLVRGDGSTSHEGIFDLDTGEFVRQTTQQGWRNDSSWARGHAWSLYGFTSMYALTGNPHWLATAQLNGDYWLEHTADADPVPPNDFDEPNPVRRWESSAAACAAGGLIMLAALVADDDQAQRYHDQAEVTIARLCEPEFLAHEESWEGVLKHGSYHETKQLGVDESVMWGEYFFVEALDKLLGAPAIQ